MCSKTGLIVSTQHHFIWKGKNLKTVLLGHRPDCRSRNKKKKIKLTCFAESLEGARVSRQLEDPDDSKHFDNPDQSELWLWGLCGIWILMKRMISYLKNCAILRTWHKIHQLVWWTKNNLKRWCWWCFTFTFSAQLSLSTLPPHLLMMFHFHFLCYLLICWWCLTFTFYVTSWPVDDV